MLFKTPAAALRSNRSALHASCPATSILAPCLLRQRRATVPQPTRVRQMRWYASIQDAKPGQSKPHTTSDPLGWPTSLKPTPYEILGVSRDAPYTKARYFELAKLYHPDRQHHTSTDGMLQLTKLERYRLVVAAHEILSNPQKKRMYDLYGFGWDNQADPSTRYREADRAWRQEPGNPSMNGTWEDWERWQRARDGTGEKQEEVFTSNLGFMAIISAFLIIGTWAQMTRAGANSVSLLEMRDQNHDTISRELRERRSQRVRLDREGRVEDFLRKRELEKWAYDPPGHGLPAPNGTGSSESQTKSGRR